eukprot:m.157587 g.157587  ORF g.157587 m.157587 type:complete len:1060 (+) comp16311_c3_seq1:114-3293(+)
MAEIRSRAAISGRLQVYTGRFSGWQSRHCQIVCDEFSYSPSPQESATLKLDLKAAYLIEASNKNLLNGFEIIAKDDTVVLLQAETRVEMEKWWEEMLRVSKRGMLAGEEFMHHHHWYYRTGKRSRTCATCQRSCGGVGQKVLMCEACRAFVHRGCLRQTDRHCKWTTFESIPEQFRFEGEICHQWSARPSASPCDVCAKSIEGLAQLCMWCKQTVHGVCRMALPRICSLGEHSLSIVRPCDISRSITRVAEVSPLGQYVVSPPHSANPLIVFVNTKSGSNDGVSILRLMRYFLNPAQVFDLSHGGPASGLRMLQDRPTFRALGCGGDGTIGWILHEADKLNIRNCQLAVLPLGTGNDLARVLGWGGAYSSAKLQDLSDYLDAVAKAKVSLLDRWSVRIVPHEVPELETTGRSSHSSATTTETTSSSQSPETETSAVFDEREEDAADDDEESQGRRIPAQRSTSRFPRPRFASVSVFRRSGSSTRIKSQPFLEGQRAVRQGYDQAVTLGGKLLEELRHILEGIQDDKPSRRPSDLDFMSRPNSSRASLSAALPLDFVQLTGTTSNLQSCLETLGTNITRSASFARDSSSRVQEALDRALALAQTLEYHAPIWNEMTTMQQRRVVEQMCKATEHILNTLSVFMAAHVGISSLRGRRVSQREGSETSVLNNYFGIGLDAKIALDFDLLRKHHPEKCRSRLKNKMWYGIMGAKEMASPSCKNLHRRIKLECDGKVIKLPKLQGLVILNIPSYMGGVDFWGRPGASSSFRSQSFEDGHLEVIAVRGSSEMAAAKTVPGYNPRRLCQARNITINIQGNEPIPVQVDGEPWMQTPAVIHISHKNTVQLLARDKAFLSLYNGWQAKGTSRLEDDMISTFRRAVERVLEFVRTRQDDMPADVKELVETISERHKSADKDVDTFTPFLAVEYIDAVDLLSTRLHEVFDIPGPQDEPDSSTGEARARLDMEGDDISGPCRLTVLDAQLALLLQYVEEDPTSRSPPKGLFKRSSRPSRTTSQSTSPAPGEKFGSSRASQDGKRSSNLSVPATVSETPLGFNGSDDDEDSDD